MGESQIGEIWIQPQEYDDTVNIRMSVLTRITELQAELDTVATDPMREWEFTAFPRLAGFARVHDYLSVDDAAALCTDLLNERSPEDLADDVEALLVRRAGRDIVFRVHPGDPSKLICFAGAITWDDAPDGYAYRMRRLIQSLDLDTTFHLE